MLNFQKAARVSMLVIGHFSHGWLFCESDSSVRGILQARIVEQVVTPSRGSFWPWDRTCVSCRSCIAGGFFTTEPPGKPSQLSVLPQGRTPRLREGVWLPWVDFIKVTPCTGQLAPGPIQLLALTPALSLHPWDGSTPLSAFPFLLYSTLWDQTGSTVRKKRGKYRNFWYSPSSVSAGSTSMDLTNHRLKTF